MTCQVVGQFENPQSIRRYERSSSSVMSSNIDGWLWGNPLDRIVPCLSSILNRISLFESSSKITIWSGNSSSTIRTILARCSSCLALCGSGFMAEPVYA